MKRLFAMLLALAMVITCLPAKAFAATVVASGNCGDSLTWELTDDGVLTVSGEGAMAAAIAAGSYGWHTYNSQITTVVIEDGVTNIGDWAFYQYSNLTEVTIADSVTAIGSLAFNECTALTAVTLPDGLTSLADGAFLNCSSLSSVTIPDSVTSIDHSAFSGCSSMTQVTMGSGITSIGNGAFGYCSNLNRVIFQSDAPAFGSDVFQNVTATVSYPENMSGWDTAANQNYGGTLTWEAYTMGVGGNEGEIACGTCGDNVTWTLFEDGTLAISGEGAMTNAIGVAGYTWYTYENQITAVVIEDGVTSIGDWAFYCYPNLAEVTIADTVTAIGSLAFYECTALTEVVIPDSVESIADGAFCNCSGLTSVTMGSGLTSIDHSVFSGCSGLTSVTIGSSVASIGNGAFGYCTKLTSVYFTGDAPTFGENVFNSVTATVRYPENMSGWDTAANQNYGGTLTWEAYTMGVGGNEGEIASGQCGDNVYWSLVDGVMTISGEGAMWDNEEGDPYWLTADAQSITSVIIEEGVTSVGSMAFIENENVSHVEFPSTLTVIGGGAFNRCALTDVTIPATVTEIGGHAFFWQTTLATVTVEGSPSIGGSAFGACPNLQSVTFLGDAATFDSEAFFGTTTTIYYPADNSTWYSIVGNEYSGTLFWCVIGGSIERPAPETVEEVASGTHGEIQWTVYNDGRLVVSSASDQPAVMAFDGAPWYQYRTEIWEVYVGDNITSLDCGNLTNLPLVETVTLSPYLSNLPGCAFCGATRNLQTVIFEGDAPNISSDAFLGVTATVYYPDGNSTWDSVKDQNYEGTLTWQTANSGSQEEDTLNASGNCGDLSWVLDNGVLTISGNGAMPDYMGGEAPWCAFTNSSIKAVVIEEGVTRVGTYAFHGRMSLASLQLPSTLESIGECAFGMCYALDAVTLPENLINIGDGAFEDTPITTITIPASVLYVGVMAFNYCNNLTEILVDADNTLYTSVDGVLFTKDMTTLIKCPNAKTGSYTVPAGVENMTGTAFQNCQLTSIVVCDGVTEIGDNCFNSSVNLETVELPASVSYVGEMAFASCDNLSAVSFTGDAPTFDPAAFAWTTTTVYYPDGNSTWDSVKDQNYEGTLTWQAYITEEEPAEVNSGTCGDNLSWVLTSDGVLTISGTGAMYDYPNGFVDAPWGDHRMDITGIVIGDEVTYVGIMAFEGCEGGVSSITIGDSVAAIGESAFFGACNGVTQLTIPASCTTIGSKAFYGCARLTDLVICGDNVTIGSQAFANGAFDSSMNIRFEGAAGSIDATAFEYVTANVSYPNDGTWDNVANQNYGGTLTWAAYTPGVCDGHVAGTVNGFDACVGAVGDLHICANNFPDGNFRSYVSSFDTDGDGYLSATELAAVQTIECVEMGITTIEGVEFFSELLSLNVDSNEIGSVDLSGNTKLEYLNLRNNNLTSVDVTMLPDLREVLFCMNELTSLDLSQNTKLERLSFPENQLTSIDLSNNPNIYWLVCYMNGLTALDVTGLANLTWLDCDENQITTLDVSQNTKLETLLCASNQLGSLDITANTALVDIHAANCGLTSLDITQNPNLQALRVNNNHGITITGINDACHEDLLWLDYGNCQISIDHSKMTSLQSLQCYANNLTSLDVSMLPDLQDLSCSENMLKVLDLSANPNLQQLLCANNQLLTLDLSGNPNLHTLYCNNQYYDGTFPTVTTDPDYGYVVDMNSIVTGNVMSVESVDGSGAIYNVGTNEAYFQNDPSVGGFWYHYAINFAADPDYTMKVGVGPVPYEDAGGVEGGGSGSVEADPFVPSANCTDSTSEKLHICQYNFPDPQFLAYVQQYGGDWDGDGYLTRSEAGSVLTIACEDWGIASLEGMQYFSELYELYAMNNQLTSIDLSGNTELRHLHIGENHLTSLDVSMLPYLESLEYNNNQVGFVDLSNNPNLNDLHCINTGISSLDVSMLPNLQFLYCSSNDITSLDLSANPNLKDLGVDGNENLTSLTLAAGTSLRHIDYSHTGLTFDITQHPDLEVLRCSGMGISSIDFSANTCLRELSLNENQLTSLDVSMLPDLETLDITSNAITSLDLSANPKIKQLYIGQNCMSQLDLSACTALEEVHVENQFVQKSITWTQTSGGYEVDMHQFVTDISKILRVDGVDSFDTATGIATYGGEPEEVTYAYDTGWNGTELPVVVNSNCYHCWVNIDCTTRNCNWCGVVETGDFHNWQPATCISLETCVECGLTQGTYEPHHYTQWVTTTAPTTTAAGERSRSCEWCGGVDTQTIAQLPDDGSVAMENVTDIASNDLNASVSVSYDAIAEGEAPGEYVSVALTAQQVEDVDLDSSTMEKLEEQANYIVNGLDQSFSSTGAVFMDIDLIKQVGTDAPETVTQTNEPVTVTISVPAELQNSSMLYYIIRVHEGVAEVLPCTYDAATGTLSFQTDRFSTYTLFWVQTEEAGGEEGGEETEFVDLELGEQTHGIADEQILYFKWVAPEEGDLSFTMLSDSWLYAAVVEHTDGTTEETPEYSITDDEPVESTTFHVYEGDTVLFAITTHDVCAGEVAFNAAFVPASSGEETEYEAVVNGVEVESLEQALASSENMEITLLKDVYLSEKAVINGSVTLDLNGHTLSAAYMDDSNYSIVVKGSLTLTGGTVQINSLYGIGVTGSLTVEGTHVCAGVDMSDYLIGNWGSTTICSGNFEGIYCCVNNFAGTTVIYGGSFNTAAYDFTGEYEACDVFADSGLTIYGGDYSKDVSEYCADGLKVELDADGRYQIVKFDFAGVNMDLGNSLTMNFAVAASNISDGYYAEIVKTYADERGDVTYTIPMSDWELRGSTYVIAFKGIAAKEMADNITATIYNADGQAVSNPRSETIRAYAIRQLAKSTASAELKTTLVDMLNYGAAAQVQFSYNTADLANSTLTAEQAALATAEVSATDNRVKGDNYGGSQLILESQILMKIAFLNVTSDMSAQISYTDHYGNAHTIDVAYSEMEVINGTMTAVLIDELVIADARQLVTVTVYNADGTVYGTGSDSVESYAARQIAKGESTLATLCETILKFGVSAYNYFH